MKIFLMSLVTIHNWSFAPNSTTTFKYVLSKTVRQNLLVGPLLFGLENRSTIGFWQTVLDSRYLNIVVRLKIGSNGQLWIETRGTETIFAIFLCPSQTEASSRGVHFSSNSVIYLQFVKIDESCILMMKLCRIVDESWWRN